MEKQTKRKAKEFDFTQGEIVRPLVQFALPVLFALFLQSMYGAVDLLVVGRFGTSADVSAVSTGSQIMMTVTNLVNSFAMGMTILLGQQIGQGNRKRGGETIGAGVFEFSLVGAVMTVLLLVFAPQLSSIMHAPEEAFDLTVTYVRICGGGFLVIIAYTLIGSVFRGIGDSRTPLIAVGIACVTNIFGDLLLVAGFHMGTAGAAIATVAAQAVSVVLSLVLILRQELPFAFTGKMIRLNKELIGKITLLGAPLALQDLLVGISFLVILAIVNGLGLTASAGVGVAEKVCAFIMLVPSAFMQAMSAFVAQNAGAGRMDRAFKSLKIGVGLSLAVGIFMGALSFFRGDLLVGIFTTDPVLIEAAWAYLRAYAIDCLLTAIFFVCIGFFNGIGLTKFVMLQGIVSAFCVRIPVSWLMSRIEPVSLFRIGLATPCSSLLQVFLCIGCLVWLKKKQTAQAK